MKHFSFKNIKIWRLFRIILEIAGFFLILMIILACTSLPFWGYYWLGTSRSEMESRPETIILLGGSGMPGESNLIRSWFTAKIAHECPESRIIVAMPGDISDSLSTPAKIKGELIIRGIGENRISFEPNGTNTRSQALECYRLLPKNQSVLLVSSPEYMRRAVLTFRKTGFENVSALPAFENASEADFSFKDDELGGRKTVLPDIGSNTQIRYQIWNHLKYEIIIIRECLALIYYRLRGWT